jgi:hypothetical protein
MPQGKDRDGPTDGEPDAVKVARPVRKGEWRNAPLTSGEYQMAQRRIDHFPGQVTRFAPTLQLNIALLAPGSIFLALCIGYAITVLNKGMRRNPGAGEVQARIAARIAKIKQHQKRREWNPSFENGTVKAHR